MGTRQLSTTIRRLRLVTTASAAMTLISVGPADLIGLALTASAASTSPQDLPRTADAAEAWLTPQALPAPETAVASSGTASTTSSAAVVTRDLAEGHAELIFHAVELFADAGLELPSIEFVGHTDARACNGKIGGSHRAVGGSSVIDLCTMSHGTVGLRIMLHEIAHAWVAASLSEATRQEFQELRGWRYWRNYELAEWRENGTEQAAEIVMWGLIDRPIRMTKIDDASCAALHAGFVLLTGREPLHANGTWCEPRPRAVAWT